MNRTSLRDSAVAAPEKHRPKLNVGPQSWINLLGVRVSALNLPAAVSAINNAIDSRDRGYICVTGVHGVIESQRDQSLRTIHNNAFLVTPDGMPLVWSLRLSGYRDSDRVYGPDLMLAMIEEGQHRGHRQFLYGSTPDTLAMLKARLLERFPHAQIVGTYSPPFRPLTHEEEVEIAELINRSGADIVWVGLSTPRQERWMSSMRPTLEAPILIGVGAAFDFHAGLKRQAPKTVQKIGLEWAFRLATEPRRLWRRYAVIVPTFAVLIVAQLLGRHVPIGEPR
jgi:N-acetylglucosaminyldiphosphoundecaprenol N-acetyl-beta-D-mannosaminyltransferase